MSADTFHIYSFGWLVCPNNFGRISGNNSMGFNVPDDHSTSSYNGTNSNCYSRTDKRATRNPYVLANFNWSGNGLDALLLYEKI